MRAFNGNRDLYLANSPKREFYLESIERKNPQVCKVSGMVDVLRFVCSSGKSSKAVNQQALFN
jgi:hypothetical protein